MGNTNSADLNTPVMLPRVDFLSVDYVLDKLSDQSALETSIEIRESCYLATKERLVALAENIYDRSIDDHSLCLKYVELAKELSDLGVFLTGEIINFKVCCFFISFVINIF